MECLQSQRLLKQQNNRPRFSGRAPTTVINLPPAAVHCSLLSTTAASALTDLCGHRRGETTHAGKSSTLTRTNVKQQKQKQKQTTTRRQNGISLHASPCPRESRLHHHARAVPYRCADSVMHLFSAGKSVLLQAVFLVSTELCMAWHVHLLWTWQSVPSLFVLLSVRHVQRNTQNNQQRKDCHCSALFSQSHFPEDKTLMILTFLR